MSGRVVVAEGVAAALSAGRGVVALETTLVTHGFPHPEGLAIARAMEEAIAAAGAVPATIGVLAGEVRIGLPQPELDRLANTPGVVKLNPGNLAAVIAAGGTGSTTVAATLFLAGREHLNSSARGGE